MADPFTAAPYAGTEDAWIFNNAGGGADQNTGNDGRINIGGLGGGSDRHQLLRFNVSTLNGQYSSINSVTLRLTWLLAPTALTGTIQAYSVSAANAGWVEGFGTTGVPSSPGWST